MNLGLTWATRCTMRPATASPAVRASSASSSRLRSWMMRAGPPRRPAGRGARPRLRACRRSCGPALLPGLRRWRRNGRWSGPRGGAAPPGRGCPATGVGSRWASCHCTGSPSGLTVSTMMASRRRKSRSMRSSWLRPSGVRWVWSRRRPRRRSAPERARGSSGIGIRLPRPPAPCPRGLYGR